MMCQHLDLNGSFQILNWELFLHNRNSKPVHLHSLQAPQMQADILSRPLGPPLTLATAGTEVLSHVLPSHGTDMLQGDLSVDKGTMVCDESRKAVLPGWERHGSHWGQL